MFPVEVFRSEASAANLLQQVRWRESLQCPRCLSESVIKYGSYREYQRYRCENCGRTFNDKTGTIFAHAKIGLDKLLFAFYSLLRINTSIRQLEDALHMALVRSDHAHAEIVDIDTTTAENHSDCVAVFTANDLIDRYQPMPCGIEQYEEWALARHKIRFAGEPIAAVVASNRYVADSCTRPGSHQRDPGLSRPLPTKTNARSSKRRSKKVGRRNEDATVVTIDQTRKAVEADLYAAWYLVGERPTVGVSASREGVNLLGAVTEYGETTVLECGGSFTGEVTIRFLEHLQAEFGEKLVVLLDKATYFTVAAVKDFAADEPIELVYFPTGSPDLIPSEEYWRRLKLSLATRYFGSCGKIRSAVWTALESISPPGVYQYLCL